MNPLLRNGRPNWKHRPLAYSGIGVGSSANGMWVGGSVVAGGAGCGGGWIARGAGCVVKIEGESGGVP